MPRRSRSRRFPRAARSASGARSRRIRSTSSSTPSTTRRASRSSAGRRARRWRSATAASSLNDALGNLAPFLTDTSDLFDILARQEEALRGAVADTGTTFEALSERGSELTNAIRGGRNTFSALASEQEALSQLFQILPVFQRESRATIIRLDQFQEAASPLIEKLDPVAEKLRPTLADVRRLSPNLRDLFVNLEDLNRVSLKGLPALRDFLDGLAPVIDELDHFLANLNPILRYLEYQKTTVADFLAGPRHGDGGSARRLRGRPGASPLPAPAHGARHRGAFDLPQSPQHQPRQRLPRRTVPSTASRRPRSGSSRTSTAATRTTSRAPTPRPTPTKRSSGAARRIRT